MIGKLTGTTIFSTSDTILLETSAGVGYDVFVHGRLLADLGARQTISLWIHSHIREDAFQLFGFETLAEKDFFLGLLKVNGVGPKLAMNILSGASLDIIARWIDTADVKALTKLPKVGKKIAEQMILQLKGKLVVAESSGTVARGPKSVKIEITSALENLGYRGLMIHEVIANLPAEIGFEEGLRQSLALLSSENGV